MVVLVAAADLAVAVLFLVVVDRRHRKGVVSEPASPCVLTSPWARRVSHLRAAAISRRARSRRSDHCSRALALLGEGLPGYGTVVTLPFCFPRPLGSRFALSCRWSRRASPTSDRGTERREREAKWHRSFRLSVNEAVAGGEWQGESVCFGPRLEVSAVHRGPNQ